MEQNNCKPEVSIVIPVYNGESVIERCVNHILKQSFQSFEIIIVNDGSSDNTEFLCKKFVEIDSRIHLINKENEGVSKTRNRGIKEAKGEFVLFIDCDDYISDTYVEHMVSKMKDTNADIVISGYTRHKYGTITECRPENDFFETRQMFARSFFDLYNKWFLNTPWNKMFKLELIRNEFPTDLSLGEDLIFNLEYLKNCNRIAIFDEVGYQYQIIENSGSLAEQYREDRFDNSLFLHNYVLSFAKEYLNMTEESEFQDEAFVKGIRFAMTNLHRASNVSKNIKKAKMREWSQNEEVLAAYRRCRKMTKQDKIFKFCIERGWLGLIRVIMNVFA